MLCFLMSTFPETNILPLKNDGTGRLDPASFWGKFGLVSGAFRTVRFMEGFFLP